MRYSSSAEFARQQIDLLAGAMYRAGEEVHFEIGDAQLGGRGRAAAAPQQRFEPRQQFRESVRLDQIVVAAGPQAFDAIVDRAEGAEDQNRDADFGGAERGDDGEPVHARQHAVDDQRVVGARAGHKKAVAALLGDIDGIAAFAEPLGRYSAASRSSSMTRSSSRDFRSGALLRKA